MRTLLALIVVLGAAAPASAGTWEPTSSLSHSRHVAVGPDGSTLLGWGPWNDPVGMSEVRYARVADDGSLGPDVLVASQPGNSRAAGPGTSLAGPTVFDGDGNATLIWSFDDGSKTSCCHRYETAVLPRGAEAPIAHQQIEPPGPDRLGLQVAVAPSGERVGAWVVDRPYGSASLIQVLDAPAGQEFGRPQTIADERVQLEEFGSAELRVLVERDGTTWVFWTTEQERDKRTLTAVRAARRSPGARRWHVRTLQRVAMRDPGEFRIDDWSLQAVSGGDDELLVGWKECDEHDGGHRCRLKWRWRRSGSWGRARGIEGTATYGELGGSWGVAMDRRGRAMLLFDACPPGADGALPGGCTLRVATGRRGQLGEASLLAPGYAPVLASSRTGQTMLLYTIGSYGDDDPAHYARAGTITAGFGPPERLDASYTSSRNSVGIDNRGNFAATFLGYDAGTYLLRYRR